MWNIFLILCAMHAVMPPKLDLQSELCINLSPVNPPATQSTDGPSPQVDNVRPVRTVLKDLLLLSLVKLGKRVSLQSSPSLMVSELTCSNRWLVESCPHLLHFALIFFTRHSRGLNNVDYNLVWFYESRSLNGVLCRSLIGLLSANNLHH